MILRATKILLAATLSWGVAAEEGSISPTLDKLMGLKIIRNIEIAPDGSMVAFRSFENDFKADVDMGQLWVISTDGGTPVQLTHGEKPVGEFEWTADSAHIAFIRDAKLAFISPAGGEPITPEFDAKGVRNLRFAADGSAMFYLAGPDDKKAKEAREKRYGKYNVVREDGNYAHIWRAALKSPTAFDDKPKQLTDGRDFSVTGYSLSPDDSTIAFATWPSPHLVDLLDGRIHTMPAGGGEISTLDDSYGVKSTPVWHTNGDKLAYNNTVGFPNYSDIVISNADGTNKKTIDTPNHDANLLRFEASGITFSAGVRETIKLYTLNPTNENIVAIDTGTPYSVGHGFSRDGVTLAYLSMTETSLAEIAIRKGGVVRALTNDSKQIEGWSLPTKELIRWTSDEGLEIEAVLTKPAGFEAGKRYPIYVRTHGGPTGTDRPLMNGAPRSLYDPIALSAEMGGALVLQTNYRGSASYGEAFQQSNHRNLGIGPARDIIAGVTMLINEGLVDPNRVACLGWSQGGHISAMLATYSDICTAVIMGAGISDWRTYYYNTDITQFTTEYFAATPLKDDDVYAKTSPVTYIDNAKTPVLIQHGENDARVPIANGYQFRQLLLDKGVDARMLVYAGMGHGPSKPRTRRAINEHAIMWFREHLASGDSPNYVAPVAPATEDTPEQ